MKLSELISADDEYLTADVVAEIEGCCMKTAYKYLDQCNQYLKKKGVVVHPKKGRTPAKVYAYFHGYAYEYVMGKYTKIKGTSAN